MNLPTILADIRRIAPEAVDARLMFNTRDDGFEWEDEHIDFDAAALIIEAGLARWAMRNDWRLMHVFRKERNADGWYVADGSEFCAVFDTPLAALHAALLANERTTP